MLAISYILLCALSIILFTIKSDDAEESGLKLFNTLDTIEEVITAQSDTLITLIDSISALKYRMDKIVVKTEEAILQREQSQKVFDEQNRLLERSNELTQKQLEEAKPEVTIYTEHITFAAIDSLTAQIRIVYTNEGERIATEFKTKWALALKSKIDNKYSYKFLTPPNESDIYPSKMLVGINLIPISYKNILNNTNEGMLIVSMRYIDELFFNKIEKQLVFRLQIHQNNITVFKESDIPKELEDDLLKNKINLAVD